jgi:carboxyl-terminal processing protease
MMMPSHVARRFALAVVSCLAIPAAVCAQKELGLERDRMKGMLEEVSRQIEKNYYDANMKGLDWKGLTEQAKQKIDKANSVSDMLTAIFSLVDKLQDSHTVFVPPQRATKVKFGFNAKPYGDEIHVYEIKGKSPAEAAGLERGDRILALNGFAANPKTWDVMMLYFRALQPVVGMEVVVSRGSNPPQKILIPGKIEQGLRVKDLTDIDTVYQLIREEESAEADQFYHYKRGDDGVGYVQFLEFPHDVEFLDNLVNKIKNSKATIVDLRGNPGGSIEALASTAGRFETEATPIADLIGRKKTETLKAKVRKPALTGPMFILVDSETASAGEMFARHFQLLGRAKVIGDHTSGRVLEANLYHEQFGADTVIQYGVEISIARVIFPGGEDLEKHGVTPDIPCVPTGEQIKLGIDLCRAKAYSLARQALGVPDKSEVEIELK